MEYREVSPTDPDPTGQGQPAGQMVRCTSPEDSDPPPPQIAGTE